MKKMLFTLIACSAMFGFGLKAQTSTPMEDWLQKNDCLLRNVMPAVIAHGEDGNCLPSLILSNEAEIFAVSPSDVNADGVSCQIVLIRDGNAYYGAYMFEGFTTIGPALGQATYVETTNRKTGAKNCMLVYQPPALTRPEPIGEKQATN